MPLNREYWWSTKQPQVTDLPCWQLGFQWHRWGIELVFKSLDCFTKRLFHTATFFAATYVFVVWNFTRLITSLKSFFFFFNLDLVGEHSAFTICAVYWSLGRRGYFGVSNVVLVNLGRPIFSLNHRGASAATVFIIPTTFRIAHAPCYTRAERATQSAARVGSSLFDFLTVPSTHYVHKIVFTFSPICRACKNSIAIYLIIMWDLIFFLCIGPHQQSALSLVCVCVCICLVHQVAHPSFGEQCLFTYPLIVLLLLCYFLPLLLWFLGHLPWSILHILFFPWLFCIRLKHAFVFHLPLDIGGMFCFRTCLHNWLLLVASLFLPLLYCYIVFLSFFLGTLLFFWVFFLPSCPASVLP